MYPHENVSIYAGFAEVDDPTKKWWDQMAREREQLSEDARAEFDAGGTWKWGASLRHQWKAAKQLDKDLAGCFSKTWNPPHDQRIATDGLVEQRVEPPEKEPRWVPVVPNGYATRNLSWKKWCFLQLHAGIFGVHRRAKVTYALLVQLVYWLTMKTDVFRWTDECLACTRFRNGRRSRSKWPSCLPPCTPGKK